MDSQKRSDEELKEILKKMNNKAKKVEEETNKKLVEKVSVSKNIVNIPQGQPNPDEKKNLVDNADFIKSCSKQIQQSPEFKQEVAKNVSLSVQKYKKEQKKIADSKKDTSKTKDMAANYPLPKGTVIVHRFQEDNIDKEQHYIIDRCLSQGGCGMTYIATYPGEKQGCKVVVKELYPFNGYRRIATNGIDWSWDKEGQAKSDYEHQFEKETKRIDELIEKHNGNVNNFNLVIPKTKDFECFGNKYYVMEFVNGSSLTNIMYSFQNNKQALDSLPISCRLQIMVQLCNAINNLHKIDCVHHDISPNNVMVDFDNEGNVQLKVIDYGLATNLNETIKISVSEFRKGGTGCFTDTFDAVMVDEYKNADKAKQKLIDIYSLGAVLGYLCLLDVDFIKKKEFSSTYREMLRKETYYYQHNIDNNDNNDDIAAKLQHNLIMKLVRNATVMDLNKRIKDIGEFSDKLKEIINIDGNWVAKCRKVAFIQNWLKVVDEYSNEIKANAQDIKNIIESHNDALVAWKDGEKHLERAENGKQEIKDFELELDKASDSDLDTRINQISIIDSEYNNAITEFDKAQAIFDLGVQIDERIVKIKKWVKDAPGLSDRVSRLKSRTEEKAAKNPDVQDNWKAGYNAFIQAENLRISIEKVNTDNADDNVLDTTIQNITLANNAYNDAENRFNDIKALQTVNPDGNKFIRFIIGLIIGIVLSVGVCYMVCDKTLVTPINPTENILPEDKRANYINVWLESSYKTSIKELESQSEKLKECSSKSKWNKANQYLTEAKNIRDEIIGINLGTASDKDLDDIVAQTKIADKKFEEARIIFEKINDSKAALVAEMTDLFIKARTDKTARQEIKNRISDDIFVIAYKNNGTNIGIAKSVDEFFSPIKQEDYIIGETHRIIKINLDSKNKITQVFLEEIN